MRLDNIGTAKSIEEYVKTKLERLDMSDRSMFSLYKLMFSERKNVFFEKSVGYRIEKTTYGESFDRIERKAATLKKLISAEPNSTVGLYMDNGIEWIETFWAIIRAGYNPLLMNIRLDKDSLEEILERLSAVAVISDKTEFSVKTVTASEIIPEDFPINSDTCGEKVMFMSSGTSSKVKVCVYTAEEFRHQIKASYGIISESNQIKKHYKGELKQLTFLPFYHIFGFVAVYLWFGFFSRTFVNLNDMAPTTVLNTIRRHNVTHIFAVPLFWNRVYAEAISVVKERGDKVYAKFLKGQKIATALDFCPPLSFLFRKVAFKEIRDNMFGESISFLISGGSEIKKDVLTFFNSIGYHLANGYGMTEIGITSVELSDKMSVLVSGSIGKPMESVEYRIGENGHLIASGKSLSKTIITLDGASDRDALFDTMDIAEEKKGRYYVFGRADDLVISESGENLNPSIIEAEFDGISNITDVCLVAQNGEKGEIPTLIFSLNRFIGDDELLTVKEQIQSALEKSGYLTAIGKIIYTSDSFLQGDEIKKNRRLIKEKASNGGFTPFTVKSNKDTLLDDVTRTVISVFSATLKIGAERITPDFNFFTDGGGTSLDYFTVLTALGEKFSVSIPIDDAARLSSVEAIVKFIKEKTL